MKYTAPLYQAIQNHTKKKSIPFHMPVHNGGNLFSAEERKNLLSFDVTELTDTDNLSDPQGCILQAEELFAECYSAKRSFLLTGGATAGIHAMLYHTCRGSKLILDVHAHKSVLAACVMFQILPVFIERPIIEPFGVADAVAYETVHQAVKQYPDAKAIFITTPTSYGICTDLTNIAILAKEYGMLLLVDQAHGAHFPFCSELPLVAGAQGADLWVCSIHKTLGAPTQTAVLNLTSERVDEAGLKGAINLIHTTSPSYLLMCYADLARAKLATEGQTALRRVIRRCEAFKKKLERTTNCICLQTHDPLRLVIHFGAYDITGVVVAEKLSTKYTIEMEMGDMVNVVGILGPCTTQHHLDQLYDAISDITQTLSPAQQTKNYPSTPLPKMTVSPWTAANAQAHLVPLFNASGRISSDTVCVYPPGVPVLVPGALIEEKHIAYLNVVREAGGQVLGMAGEGLLKVICQEAE